MIRRTSKRNLIPQLLLVILLAATSEAAAKPFHVVIDPGHGGNDHGTEYGQGRAKIAEKEVTLLLATDAARELRDLGFRVTLTREEDQEVSLGARTALANKLNADLFISIHMNSGEAQGVETFILNNTSDMTSRRLAKLENSVLGRDSASDSPEALDVALILRDLRLDANLSESKLLACSVQEQLVERVSKYSRVSKEHKDRGVKQALFHVLLGAEMPSVLVEAGFLNHPKDRFVVTRIDGRHAIGSAIAQAVDKFRKLRGTRNAQSALSRCQVH